MPVLDDVNSAIENLTLSTSTQVQTGLAPLGLTLLRDILARDWSALDEVGEGTIAIGRAGYDAGIAALAERKRRVLDIFVAFERSRLSEVDAGLFAAGEEGDADLDTTVAQFLARFRQAQTHHDGDLRSDFEAGLTLSYAAHGIKARSFAGFNLRFAEETPSEATSGSVEAETAVLSGQVRQMQLDVYHAILSGTTGPALRDDMAAAATELETALPAFYAGLAPAARAYLGAVDDGAVGLTDALGRALTAASDAWREGLCTYVALNRLRRQLLLFKRTGEIRKLVDRAGAFAFDAEVPNGTDVDIGDLDSRADGDFVELRGVVEALDQDVLSDDSLVSKLVLRSSNGAARVTCAVRFAHLGRIGIGEGSYLRVNGFKSEAMPVLDDGPGVRIDHVSHVALAGKSWRYAFLRLSEPYFPRWRHKLNISWSPMPHLAPGAGRAVAGANEFIYSPFLR